MEVGTGSMRGLGACGRAMVSGIGKASLRQYFVQIEYSTFDASKVVYFLLY
jgi:hypothetical protein